MYIRWKVLPTNTTKIEPPRVLMIPQYIYTHIEFFLIIKEVYQHWFSYYNNIKMILANLYIHVYCAQ